MRIPNAEDAWVGRGKLTKYLLSTTHPIGRSKADFFRRMGFTDANVGELEKGLVTIAKTEEVLDTERSEHGAKYIIHGSIATPGGRVVRVRTIWIIEHGQEGPRFVTAYPLSEREP